jgi:hypothetical protein
MEIIEIFTSNYLASTEEQDKRKAICEPCDKNKMGVCSSCLCIIPAKVAYKQSSCPEGKWNEC